MRRLGLIALALLVLAGCSEAPGSPPGSSREAASGPLRTIARAPVPARTSHVAAWTGEEMVVWGGQGALEKSADPKETPRMYARLLTDGAAYDPKADKWRRIAAGPLTGRTAQNVVWTGSLLLIWGGDAQRKKLKDGAAYDPATDTWTALPGAPAARSGAQTAWTGTEALFIGGSGSSPEGGVAYNPATRTWRALPTAPVHSYDWALSTWTGKELLLFTEMSASTGVMGAAYDPVRDTWRKIPKGPVAAGSASGVVWAGDRAVFFSTSPERLDGGRTHPWPHPLDPGGFYLPEGDRWERMPLAPSETAGYGTPMPVGRKVVQWGGTGDAAVYDLDEARWQKVSLPETPWRESPSLIWSGTEVIAWGGDSCPAIADCVALRPLADGVAWNPGRS